MKYKNDHRPLTCGNVHDEKFSRLKYGLKFPQA